MRAAVIAAIGFGVAGAAGAADTCEPLRAQIDTKIRSLGVERFTLTVVETAASAPGKVVGTCDRGAKKIVYLRAPSEAAITECKDGTVSVDGRCGKP